MKTLTQLSTEHLNEAIVRLGENTRLINIAQVLNDKNTLLKLHLQKQGIESEITYHRIKLQNPCD